MFTSEPLFLWCNSESCFRFPLCLLHLDKKQTPAKMSGIWDECHKKNPTALPALERAWLAWSLSSWVRRALWASMVSCMALTRTLRLLFSVCSIEFSWNMSLKLSTPSSPTRRFPCRRWILRCCSRSSENTTLAPPHRLVLHQLNLQPCYLCPQSTDLLAGFILVHHHLVLDVSGSIGVF